MNKIYNKYVEMEKKHSSIANDFHDEYKKASKILANKVDIEGLGVIHHLDELHREYLLNRRIANIYGNFCVDIESFKEL